MLGAWSRATRYDCRVTRLRLVIQRSIRFMLLFVGTMALVGAAFYLFDCAAGGILAASFIMMALIIVSVWVVPRRRHPALRQGDWRQRRKNAEPARAVE